MNRRSVGLMLALLAGLPFRGTAQQVCQVLRELGGGARLVRCGTDTLLAITTAMQRASVDSAIELEGARRTLELKDRVIATHERESALYDTLLARKNAYIAELEELSSGYKQLASGYKKLSPENNLVLEGGVGATGDWEPAILAGLGIRRLRIWGFLQEHNAGGMIGLHFRLF